jgi:hypothetical protein
MCFLNCVRADRGEREGDPGGHRGMVHRKDTKDTEVDLGSSDLLAIFHVWRDGPAATVAYASRVYSVGRQFPASPGERCRA